MADNQKHGGVAIKFEAAYFRSLHFTRSTARECGSHLQQIPLRRRAEPRKSTGSFRITFSGVMVDEAGKLHLPMHFHTCVGIGDYFSLHNGNVLNLENVRARSALQKCDVCAGAWRLAV